jgi:hypothetical protein
LEIVLVKLGVGLPVPGVFCELADRMTDDFGGGVCAGSALFLKTVCLDWFSAVS